MLNSILIGKYIFDFLSNDEQIKSICKNRIYPLVVHHDVPYPFVVFSRTNVVPSYMTKDGCTYDTVTVEVSAVSDNYNASCELANAIRKCLELKRYNGDELRISDIKLESVEESFNNEDVSFIQNLIFSIKVI